MHIWRKGALWNPKASSHSPAQRERDVDDIVGDKDVHMVSEDELTADVDDEEQELLVDTVEDEDNIRQRDD